METCEFCQGEGKIEETEMYRDVSGYYHIEGLGVYKPCFNCADQHDCHASEEDGCRGCEKVGNLSHE